MNKRKTNNSSLSCFTCNCEIKVEDMVVTQHGSRKSIRHESCARRIGLI